MAARKPTEDEKREMLQEMLDSQGWMLALDAVANHVRTVRQGIFNLTRSDEGTMANIRNLAAIRQLLRAIYQDADSDLPHSVTALFE